MTELIPHRDWIKEPLQVLSFGGGLQSVVMLWLVFQGRLPKPDIVIHSDTGSEMPYTHDVIEWAKNECIKFDLPFQIVSNPKAPLHEFYSSKATLPLIGFRSCTGHFKLQPIRHFVRSIVGNANGKVLSISWIGITTDERSRERESDLKWIKLYYPLLNDVVLSRDDCRSIIRDNIPVKVLKSGCFCCPYGGVKHFISLRATYPDLFDICVDMENNYFKHRPERIYGLLPNVRSLDSLRIDSLEKYGFSFEGMSSCDPDGGCFL